MLKRVFRESFQKVFCYKLSLKKNYVDLQVFNKLIKVDSFFFILFMLLVRINIK